MEDNGGKIPHDRVIIIRSGFSDTLLVLNLRHNRKKSLGTSNENR